ncbi:MAG: magnesium/cobalt transporter CorA, partial [Candidatus Bathyarchaeota archaeon]
HFQEKGVETIEECFPFKDTSTVTWINVSGIHEIEIIEKIGKHFGIHPLVQEDIVNTKQRPKMESFEDHIFVTLKMIYYDEEKNGLSVEQIGLIFGANFVISFQETEGDVFESIRNRLRKGKSRIRKLGSDYLAYSLLDSIVDNYILVLEKLAEKLECLEEEEVTNPTPSSLKTLRSLKMDILPLRKVIWSLRETIGDLQHDDTPLIKESTRIYISDIYDHITQAVDTIETFRDMISGMLDIYLSSMSNKTNEIMRVLAIMASVFIPLTFIASIYGMNFQYMPELGWVVGYPMALLIMTAVGTLLFVYFRRKKWL